MAIVALLSPDLVTAQPVDAAAPEPQWTGSWDPSVPKGGGWDWIHLASSEWVKGELLLMRDFDVQFDSDEFGVATLDWADVEEILTERAYTLVLQNLETTHTGTIAMRDGHGSINVGGEIRCFDRKEILAIIPSTNVSSTSGP